MVNGVLLLKNGDIKDVELKLKPSDISSKPSIKLINNKNISSYINDKGVGALKFISQWDINSDYKLKAYGYLKGKEINNHELPPNMKDEVKLYGDILMVKTNNQDLLISIDSKEYENVYNSLFGNISDSEYDDSEIDEMEMDNSDEELEDEEDEEDEDGNEENEEDEDNEEDEEDGDNDIDEMLDEDNEEMESPIIIKSKKKNKSKVKKNVIENDLPDLMEPLDEEENIDLSNELSLTDTEEDSDNYGYDLRVKIRGLFQKLEISDANIRLIEKGIFNYSCKSSEKRKIVKKWENKLFTKIYINKARSIYANIKTNSYINNVNLIKKINNNEIQLNNLAFMSPQEIYPEHWKRMMDEKYNRDKYLYESVQEAMTDQFKCSRCKSRKCTYYEMQTRSADEGMTLFVTCLNCGKRWKQ